MTEPRRIHSSTSIPAPLRSQGGPRFRQPHERKVNVALFGGSFNPPHRGHGEAVRYLCELKTAASGPFDEVWVLPTYRHAFGKTLLDFALRFKLFELLLEDLGELARPVRLLDIERWMPAENRIVDTLRVLTRDHPSCRFTLALGADLKAEFPKWKDPDGIRSMAELEWFHRPGYSLDQGGGSPVFFSPEAASSQLREAIQRGEKPYELFTPRVWEFIDRYGLYRTRPGPASPYEDVSALELVLRDTSLSHRHFGLHRWGLRNRYPDGTVSGVYFCEAVLRPHQDAVGVLPYSLENPADPTVYFRRNLRPTLAFRDRQAIEQREPPFDLPLTSHPVVLGMVAGVLEEGEKGDALIRRRGVEEVREEAGFEVTAGELLSLGSPLAGSVGMSPEFYYPFAVRIDPAKQQFSPGDGSVMEEVGGLVPMTLSEALQACLDGRIKSAFLEVCLHRFRNLMEGRHA